MYEEASAMQEEKRRPVEVELDRLYAAVEFLDRNLSNLSGRLQKISVEMPELLEADSDVIEKEPSDSEITRRIHYVHDYVQKLSERVRRMETSLEI